MSASATTSNRHTTAILLTVPQLTRRRGNARVPAVGVAITFIGMAWLSRLSADTPYMTGLALPMVVLGIGQGSSWARSPPPGIARVTTDDACAASGLVNVAHQLGGSLGLGILVTVFAAASSRTLTGSALPAHQVSAAQSAGLLALALVVVLAVILTPHRRACAHSTAGSCRDEAAPQDDRTGVRHECT